MLSPRWNSGTCPVNPDAPSPWLRLFGYIRREPLRYALGGILTLAYASCFQAIPLAVRSIVAGLAEVSEGRLDPSQVNGAIGWLVAASLGFAVLRFSSRVVMFRVGRHTEFEIRNDYFEHLQRLPQSFFNRHRTGDLMSRAINDINSIRMFLGMGLLNIVQTPVLYLGALVVMASIDPWLTFWTLIPFPIFILVARVFGRMMFRANLEGQEQLGKVSTAVQENAAGVLVVRSYELEPLEKDRFRTENDELYRRMLKVGTGADQHGCHRRTPPGAFGGFGSVDRWLLRSAGATEVRGSLGLLDLHRHADVFQTVLLGYVIAIVQRGLAALRRLGEVLDVVPTIRDHEGTVGVESIDGSLRFRDLSYSYASSGGQDVAVSATLDLIDLEVEAGQTVGIVGPVGAGKSTLVNVIPRLLEVLDGHVSFGAVMADGSRREVDINHLPLATLRESIAMVPQDSFLFSTTVAENIRFGRPGASMDEVRAAAARAHVLGDIESFGRGFETLVGERGITLSGGQRQRVALARALLLDPAILILDDSLSSVDHETEEAILGDLVSAQRGPDVFRGGASPIGRAQCRSDRSDRERPHHRSRSPPRTGRAKRPVRSALSKAAARVGTR